jgi:excisionase family DNA binding protein
VTLEDLDELAERLAPKLAERLAGTEGSGRDGRPLLTPKTLAERLAISERMAGKLISSGEIPSFKVGGSRKIDPADVDSYIDALRG